MVQNIPTFHYKLYFQLLLLSLSSNCMNRKISLLENTRLKSKERNVSEKSWKKMDNLF